MPAGNEFIAINPHCALKNLEEPCLYDIKNDELYELGQDAYQFLLRCSQGERPVVRKEDEEFIQYCLSENLIRWAGTPLRKMALSGQVYNVRLFFAANESVCSHTRT
jgi:hypothetical protein